MFQINASGFFEENFVSVIKRWHRQLAIITACCGQTQQRDKKLLIVQWNWCRWTMEFTIKAEVVIIIYGIPIAVGKILSSLNTLRDNLFHQVIHVE